MRKTKQQIRNFKFHNLYLVDFEKFLAQTFNNCNNINRTTTDLHKRDGIDYIVDYNNNNLNRNVICRVRCAQGDDTFNYITLRTYDVLKKEPEWKTLLFGHCNTMLYAIENIFQNHLDHVRVIDLDILRYLNMEYKNKTGNNLGFEIHNIDGSAFRCIDLSILPKSVNGKNLVISEFGNRKTNYSNINYEEWLQNA